MSEDFFQEGDLFKEKNIRNYKTSFTWLLVLVIANFAVEIFHLMMRLVYNNEFYRTAKPGDFEMVDMLYKLFGGVFLVMNLTLYSIAAVKVNQTIGRVFIIVIGVFQLVSYVYYQFLS